VDETTLPKGANGKIDFAETTPNASGSTTADDSNPNPSTVTLAHNGSTDATIDFGYVSLQGAIGDYVWFDANGNGLQDAGEPGINGVVVDLYDSTQTKLLATTTTAYGGPNNVNGFYQFTGLSAGNYVVAVDATTLPVNYTPTISSAGSNPAIDSDGSPAAVNLPTDSSTDATIDFGYVAPCNGAIGDFVWHDLNQNGVQDADEPGISGVKLYLYSSTHTLIQTAITNRVGYYQFSGVCEGTYEVDVDASTLPPSFTPTVSQALGSTTASDSNGSPAPVVLTLDSSNNVVSDQTIDFGYISPCNGAIGDFVWIDANGNGIQDGSEPGIADVTVSLYNLQMTLLNAATTNQNGYYQFTGLCAGKYIVQVTPPQDDIATIVNAAGSTTANDSNPSPSTVVLSIIDSNGDITNDETIDFGFVPQTPSLSCSSVTSGEVGVLFNSGAMTVSGGTAPYTFSVVGTLPAGLSLNASTGAVTGTPTAAGSFSIKVTDKNGVGATSTCLITITAGPSLSCSAVNSGEVGVLFNSGAMTVSGGTAPYTFSVVGTLPAGLALSTSTGAVTGTPSAAGTFSVRVTDAKGSMATSTCPITIAPLESASCALGLTSAYNIITLSGGISDSVDITGRIAASGQISGITTIGSWLSTKDPYITLASANGGPYAVVAGGGIASSVSVNINGGGNVYSSTATSASIGLANENYTGSAYANSKLVTGGTSPINFATVKAEMVSLSSQLAALPANGVTCLVDNFGKLISGNGCPTSTKTYNPSWVILYGSNATVNIFNVTQDQFQNDQLDIQVPTGSTAILNVSGTSDTLKYNILNQDVTVTDSNAPSILFNFPSATTVTINAQFDATLLAPKAYLSGSNQMGGTFISASMSQSNEVHYDPFTGMLQVTGACIQ
jgi:choice-of-anchor A domain-containing protein